MEINIMVEDGQITVNADGAEPYMCSTIAECSEYLGGLLAEAGVPDQTPAQADQTADMAEMPSDDSMWDEEAAKRPANPNLMT
jgi:hypothetical protein